MTTGKKNGLLCAREKEYSVHVTKGKKTNTDKGPSGRRTPKIARERGNGRGGKEKTSKKRQLGKNLQGVYQKQKQGNTGKK